MKPSRFTEEQIIGLLREQGSRRPGRRPRRCAASTESAARPSTSGRRSTGVGRASARRLKTLEDENTRLKKLPAEARQRDAEGDGVKKRMARHVCREACVHLQAVFGRACRLIGIDRDMEARINATITERNFSASWRSSQRSSMAARCR
jgi:putative transposase